MSRKSVLSRHANSLVEPELPLRAYFLSVGGALLLLLLAADWVPPAPLPSRLTDSHSALPPIRIHSDLKGPEAVVIDTTGFGLRPTTAAHDIDDAASQPPKAESPTPQCVPAGDRRRQLINAFVKAWRSCGPPLHTRQAKAPGRVTTHYESPKSIKHHS